MRYWTEESKEYKWLASKFPQWHARRNPDNRRFVKTTTEEFIKAFPDSEVARSKLQSKIRQWYHYHGSKDSNLPKRASHPILSLKNRRKIVPLKPNQAYSLMYCKKDSLTRKELVEDWKLYVAGDEDALNKYRHLFIGPHNPNLPFVAFQQVVLRDRMTSATEEELAEIEEFVAKHYEEKSNLAERPWHALKIDEAQSETDLERQYIAEQIEGLPTSLDALCNEVRSITNFKPFIMYGGPSAKGTGSIQIFHAGSGETILRGKTFQEYLGPLWDVLKNKYSEWLDATYTHEELLRLAGSVNGPSQTLLALQRSRSPDTTLRGASNPASTPRRSRSSETTLRGISNPAPTLQPSPGPAITTLTPEPTRDQSSAFSSTPSRSSSPIQKTPRELEVTHTPLRRASFRCPPGSDVPTWIPAHTPSWSLGPQHGDHIRAAVPYLIAIPGGPQWEKLLASFITFESISRHGGRRLKAKPRPPQIAWWYKNYSRLGTPKDIPVIESIQDYENQWILWWSVIQPKWRDTGIWPFEEFGKASPLKRDWGDFVNGGKYGLFIVVLSLGWWIEARNPLEDSMVDEVLADVLWVTDNLVRFLSVNPSNNDTDADDDSDSSIDTDADAVSAPNLHVAGSSAPKRKAPQPNPLKQGSSQRKPSQKKQSQKKQLERVKIGPPSKRAKRTGS